MASLACPACRAPMAEENFASARVDVCGACAGIWFDRGALARVDHKKKGAGPALQRALAVPLAAPRASTGRTCPRCAVALVGEIQDAYPAVHLDRCPGCDGIFLDGGELAALRTRPLTAVEAGKARRRRARRRRLRAAADARRQQAHDAGALIGLMLMS